jgi:hypothetical protein
LFYTLSSPGTQEQLLTVIDSMTTRRRRRKKERKWQKAHEMQILQSWLRIAGDCWSNTGMVSLGRHFRMTKEDNCARHE